MIISVAEVSVLREQKENKNVSVSEYLQLHEP